MTKNQSIPTRVGDARKGKTLPNTFAAIADSDSDSESPTLASVLAADPIHAAMLRGDVAWGDIIYDEDEAAGRNPLFDLKFQRVAAEASRERLVLQESSIWNQPWATKLSTYYGDVYDLSALTEAEYEDCMTWLYEQGWEIDGEDRAGVKAWPADLPPRVWIAPDRFEAIGHTTCNHTAPVPQTRRVAAKKSVVPRFCRTADCADADCRYVHGDTMPRLDKPCGFGAACGASDPTGVKRSQCLYMHPGETWSADLVISRP